MTDANLDAVAELVGLGLERREARWLVEEFLPGADPAGRTALAGATRRRLEGEPLQYIIGHWPFRTLDLDVDPRVLIPRPETEELVDVALGELASSASLAPLLLDLGCGSGAIGLSLLDELRSRGIVATLVALDESRDALEVARANARKHRITNVTFLESSWFAALDDSLRGRVDLIVANPPYVGEDEFAGLDPVLGYEPRGALVAPDADGVVGLGDLALIVREAPAWLRPGGSLVMEHGDAQRPALLALAEEAGFVDRRGVDDLSGRPRIIAARRPA
ncbi:MAG: peptide chain release factor N(5)-glutamine methyltransferase [Actinomycetota bacterium]|nr:peptide chain release factor N(5)-glutamine methyltransferase [Actinomycetota bacterium]